jgi:hypothetical protein
MSLPFTKDDVKYAQKLQANREYCKKARQDPAKREEILSRCRFNARLYRQRHAAEVKEKDVIRKRKKKEQVFVNYFLFLIFLL